MVNTRRNKKQDLETGKKLPQEGGRVTRSTVIQGFTALNQQEIEPLKKKVTVFGAK